MVALLNGTATSGAYYVAQAADRILAYPTTVTGSIGVILLNLNLNGLMEKIGVSNATVKSGMYKDLGSPFRQPEEGEKEILQGVVDELHGRFVQVVGENRRALKLSDHPELVDGRIFTARQALSDGLIDQIGYVADAVGWVRGAAAVPDARVIRYQRGESIGPTCIPTDRISPFRQSSISSSWTWRAFFPGLGPPSCISGCRACRLTINGHLRRCDSILRHCGVRCTPHSSG